MMKINNELKQRNMNIWEILMDERLKSKNNIMSRE